MQRNERAERARKADKRKAAQGKAAKRKAKVAKGGSPLEDAMVAATAAVALGAGVVASGVRTVKGGTARPLPSPQALDQLNAVHAAKKPEPTGIKGWLHRKGERFKPLGRALDIQERYGDLHGNNLAAAVTFQSFVSLLPLLLVTAAIVGFVAGETDVAGSVVRELGLKDESATLVTDAVAKAEESKRSASVIGLLGLLWSGLGLVNALQYASDQVWQVEARGLKDKAVGVAWLLGAVLLFLAAAAVTTVVNFLPDVFLLLTIPLALVTNFALWAWTGKVLPNTHVPWKAVVPGAIFGAIGLEILKVVGGIYVPRAVASSSAAYGALGVVFAVLAWLFFFGRLLVYSTVVNVVFHERRVGTVAVITEVPRQPGAESGEQVSRMGRLENEKTKKKAS